MTYKDLRGIALDVIKSMTYPNSINCFVVVHNNAEYSAANFNKNIKDAAANEYWTREGVKSDSLTSQYPALAISCQNKVSVFDLTDANRLIKRYTVRFEITKQTVNDNLTDAQDDDKLEELADAFNRALLFYTFGGHKVVKYYKDSEVNYNHFGSEYNQVDKLRGIEWNMNFEFCANT